MKNHKDLDEMLAGGIVAWANTTQVDDRALDRIISQSQDHPPVTRRRMLRFAVAAVAVVAIAALASSLGLISDQADSAQAGFVPAIIVDEFTGECGNGSGEAVDVDHVEHLSLRPGDAWELTGESGRREGTLAPDGCLVGRLVLASFATPDRPADRAVRIEVRVGPTGSTSIDELCELAEAADDGECFDLGGSQAQISEIGAPSAIGYVVQWVSSDQMEISVIGLGMTRDDVRALAGSVTIDEDGNIGASPTYLTDGFKVFADQPLATVDNREKAIWKGNFRNAQTGAELTLVITDPAYGGPFDHMIDLFAWIELRGTSAVVIPAATYASAIDEGERHPGSYIEWNENGRTLRLAGTLPMSELTAVANGLAEAG